MEGATEAHLSVDRDGQFVYQRSTAAETRPENRERMSDMAAVENTGAVLRMSEPDDSPSFRFGEVLNVPQVSMEIGPSVTLANVMRQFSPSPFPKVRAEQSRRLISQFALNAFESRPVQGIDEVERTPYVHSSGSPSALQAMLGRGQSNVFGSGTGQESSDPVCEDDRGKSPEAPEYGDEAQSEGNDAMASGNVKDTPEYQLGEMASDVKHLQGDMSILRGDVKDMRGEMKEGFRSINAKLDDDKAARQNSWWNLRNGLLVTGAGIVGGILSKIFF